ncbi:uncharacterized protein LOC132193000 isoform X2 [Neocloeon triangulifer]|uniref:uncharacterized protein LOC132193000 isoform X2 n=1 Tax=Neocloeon triangulifer TaxID=2078957 RepID=UPI00286F2D02|nr:uncharacterized protein LOC132193000 isoform X2 [Neocloeon triangulifer]
MRDNYRKDSYITLAGCGSKEIGINTAGIKNTYIGGYKWCCVDNSTFIGFETKEKLSCVEDLFRGKKVPKNRYWVSGTSFGCPKLIGKWCNGRDEPLIGDHIPWAPGEPSKDLSKECVYAEYDNVTSKFTFGKVGCKTSLNYICEYNSLLV